MQIVIDIPEKEYNMILLKQEINIGGIASVAEKYIANGTPLPKGHGRLIDADALKMDKRVCGDMYLSKTSLFVANKVIEQAPTIVEADKAESEDKE